MNRTELRATATFVYQLYREQLIRRYYAHVVRAPESRLLTREGRENPYPLYEKIRARGQLVTTPRGLLAATSHAVCNEILRARTFGVAVEPDMVEVGGFESIGGEELDLSLLSVNPPDHTRLRRLVQPAFRPKMMAAYGTRIEKTLGSMLDELEPRDDFDFIRDFAAPLPIVIITELLGVPDNDRDGFLRYGAALGTALDGIRGLRHATVLKEADANLRGIVDRTFQLRKEQPKDDVMSALAAGFADEKISADEVQPLAVLLLVAGFETTVNLVGNAVLALLSHPEQWEALVADPHGLAPGVVEETLRWDPPVQRTGRVALADNEIAGVRVPRGQWVTCMIGAANRDPEVYERPAQFDIFREPSVEHLAFSSGIHYCIGAPLARLEATKAIAALAERMPKLRVTGTVKRRASTLIRGVDSVRMAPR